MFQSHTAILRVSYGKINFLPYIKGIYTVIMIKTRIMRWVWNIASSRMRTRRMHIGFGRKAEGNRPLERR
jgi:hypothetical protein